MVFWSRSLPACQCWYLWSHKTGKNIPGHLLQLSSFLYSAAVKDCVQRIQGAKIPNAFPLDAHHLVILWVKQYLACNIVFRLKKISVELKLLRMKMILLLLLQNICNLHIWSIFGMGWNVVVEREWVFCGWGWAWVVSNAESRMQVCGGQKGTPSKTGCH